jgi:RNase P/RNase MRP subunit p29
MNKYQQEFIGKQAAVTKSRNRQQLLTGKIIDETKNTFRLRVKDRTITILKKDKEFRIDGKRIDGNKIMKRPEERIKIKEN